MLPGKFVYDGAQTKSQERAKALRASNIFNNQIIFFIYHVFPLEKARPRSF